jgi:phage tail sheath protein FI
MPASISPPGVYVQELQTDLAAIGGAPTAVTAFVGHVRGGPVGTPVPVSGFAEFERTFGGVDPSSETSIQVRQFFLNGGSEAWVVRVAGSGPDGTPSAADLARTGLPALDSVDLVNLLCLPDLRLPAMGEAGYRLAAAAALDYGARRRAMAILDLPEAVRGVDGAKRWIAATRPALGANRANGAAYFPEPLVPDPAGGGQPRAVGASGTMAGLFAANDRTRGVWKAPAGATTTLAGVTSLACAMTDAENGELTPTGLNALRTFPVYGTVCWGARTLAAGDPAGTEWVYIPVRRLTLHIEESLLRGLRWTALEPNGEVLWSRIRQTVSAFMQNLFQQGAFAGMTPNQAYGVACDASTTPPDDIGQGIVTLVVRFAPLRAGEFIVLTLRLKAGPPLD